MYSLGRSLGYVVTQNKAKDKIVAVEDAGGDIGQPTQRGHKTGGKLPYHVDRTDVIVLMCIRQAEEGGGSSLASSRYVYEVMQTEKPELLEELTKPIPHDRRGEEERGEAPWDLLRLIQK